MAQKFIANGDGSFLWSFGPFSSWGNIESKTILTTHPSLTVLVHRNRICCQLTAISTEVNVEKIKYPGYCILEKYFLGE